MVNQRRVVYEKSNRLAERIKNQSFLWRFGESKHRKLPLSEYLEYGIYISLWQQHIAWTGTRNDCRSEFALGVYADLRRRHRWQFFTTAFVVQRDLLQSIYL